MLFFTFRQSNPGGFYQDEMPNYLIVEAPSSDFANFAAEKQGVYFDGCQTGQDCPCCGNRWGRVYSGDGTDNPQIYGEKVELDQTVYNDEWESNDSVRVVRWTESIREEFVPA